MGVLLARAAARLTRGDALGVDLSSTDIQPLGEVLHLWVQGSNLHQNRHYSQFMGLQLKARLEGIPMPMYGLAPVHHTS